jgi:hypothetical protein
MIDPKASWTEPISSVYELIDLEEVLVKENLESGRRWAYRGQPRDYGSLMPSFQREFLAQSHGTAAIIERDLIREFRMHYGALSDRSRDMPLPTQISDGYDLRCLSVMQHYEIPHDCSTGHPNTGSQSTSLAQASQTKWQNSGTTTGVSSTPSSTPNPR